MAGGAGVFSAPALLLLAAAICCLINSADAARRGRPYSGLVDVEPTVEVIQDGFYQGRGATKFTMTELYEDVIGGLAAEADPTYYDPWGDAQFVRPQDSSSFQRTRGRQPTAQPAEVVEAEASPQRGGRGRSWRNEPRGNRVAQRRSGDEEAELDQAQAAPSINRPRSQPANQVPSEESPRSGGRAPSWRSVGRRGRKEESEEPKATEESVKSRGEESTRTRDVQSRRIVDRRRGREGAAFDQSTSASIQRSRSQPGSDTESVDVQQDVGRPESGRGGSRRSGRRGESSPRRTAERRTINEINSINGVEEGVSVGPTITSRGKSGRRNNARGTPRTATSTPTEPTLPGGIRESDNYPQEFIQKLRESTGSTQAASSTTTAIAWETPRTRTASRATPRSLPDEIPEESPSIPSRDGSARNGRPVTTSRRGGSRAQFSRVEASEDSTDERRTPDRGSERGSDRGSDRGSERGGRRGGRRGESRAQSTAAPEQDDQSSRRRAGNNRRGSSRRVTTPLAPPAQESTAAPVEVSSSTTSTTTTTQETPVSSEKTIPEQQDGVAPETSNGASESLKDIGRKEESKDNNGQDKLPAVNMAEKVPEVQSTESAPSSTTASPRDAPIGSRLSNFRRSQSRGVQRERNGAVPAEASYEVREAVEEAIPREEPFRRRGRQRVVSQEPATPTRGSSRDQSRVSGREFSRDSSRDASRDTVREPSRDTNREYSRDSSRDVPRNSRRGYSREEPSSTSQAPPSRGRADFSRGRGIQRVRTTESPSDSLITRASEAVVTVTSSGSAPGKYYRVPERLIATTTEPQRREETRRKLAALTGAKKPPIGKQQAARKTIEENRVVSKVTEEVAKENVVGVNSGEKSLPLRPVYTPRKTFPRGTSEAPSSSQGDGSISGVTHHRFSAKHHRSGDPIRTGSTTATPAYVPTVPSVASGVAPRVSTSPSGQVAPSGWNQRKRLIPKESS